MDRVAPSFATSFDHEQRQTQNISSGLRNYNQRLVGFSTTPPDILYS